MPCSGDLQVKILVVSHVGVADVIYTQIFCINQLAAQHLYSASECIWWFASTGESSAGRNR